MNTKRRILYLGPDSPLIGWLRTAGELVVETDKPVTPSVIEAIEPAFVISYSYRHILSGVTLETIATLGALPINLHISYLPWNRGADPNLWSWIDGTPKGVTIHVMDEGVDTGDIIAQEKMVQFSDDDTLRTTYDRLTDMVQRLFRAHWFDIRAGRYERMPQVERGSYHKASDKLGLPFHLLAEGWNTPVKRLDEYAAENQLAAEWGR